MPLFLGPLMHWQDVSFFWVFVTGLSQAGSLFLVASGLTLIFGVTRVVNFSHATFFMLGLYVAYTLVDITLSAHDLMGYSCMVLLAGLICALLGSVCEWVFLRPVYRSSELYQLLSTFALVLILGDAIVFIWGPEDLLGPRMPGLSGAIEWNGVRFPSYSLFLMGMGPLVLILLKGFLHHTRAGLLIRAATWDREMLGALGVNQRLLFTGVFALGCGLSGLGGALQLPIQPAHVGLDLNTIGDTFVVVVMGGLGSIEGAYLAAFLIEELRAFLGALGTVHWFGYTVVLSKLNLVSEFFLLALVLIWRPWGLLGRAASSETYSSQTLQSTLQTNLEGANHRSSKLTQVTDLSRRNFGLLFLALLGLLFVLTWIWPDGYIWVLLTECLIASLFAVSLQFLMQVGGVVSFGFALYLGVGAYASAVGAQHLGLGLWGALFVVPLLGAALARGLSMLYVRLSGIYLAMMSLAVAQIAWSVVYQWDDVTGGSNGISGIWPSVFWTDSSHYFALCALIVVLCFLLIWHLRTSVWGLAVRACADSPIRATSMGLPVNRLLSQLMMVSGAFASLSGVLWVYSKGVVSPDVLEMQKSLEVILMVLLGGVESMFGALLGAFSLTVIQDYLMIEVPYWRAALGILMLILIHFAPNGWMGLWFKSKMCLKARAS
jgi:branched-chain amino acid transport system permease protein